MHRNVDSDLQVYDLVLEMGGVTAQPEIVTCNDVPMTVEKSGPSPEQEKYVYDFYYIDQENLDIGAYIDGLMRLPIIYSLTILLCVY